MLAQIAFVAYTLWACRVCHIALIVLPCVVG